MASHSNPTCCFCSEDIHPRDLVDTRNGYFWHQECLDGALCCDCCDKPFERGAMARVYFNGLETWACTECRGAA